MSRQPHTFQDLDALAAHMRKRLQDSKYLLLFASLLSHKLAIKKA